MKNKLVLITLALALMFTGCQKSEDKKSTDQTTDQTSEIEEQKETTDTEKEEVQEVVDHKALYEVFKSTEPTADEYISYLKELPSDTTNQVVDLIITDFIEKASIGIEAYINLFYSEETYELHGIIYEAFEKAYGSDSASYVVAGQSKYEIIKHIENKNFRELLQKTFDAGYGLYSGEGSYYPVVDYMYLNELYGSESGDMIKEFLHITADEVNNPTTNEEMLAIGVDKLFERAKTYESFLRDYPNSPFETEMRIGLMVTVYKIAGPNPFDGTLDEKGYILDTYTKYYKELLADDTLLVLQMVSKEMIDYLAGTDGYVAVYSDQEGMDKLYKQTSLVHSKASELIADLYLSK